ncbi:class I SAM-dependent methyltransferase [filamentous cyanobacterium LEGE 11480]|uniref:Class I SAM-dependent methyltransferase n=1 Tax=Romeriopsis navalis LEGE 11480 TaxID=2777977 RepID=A0A928VHF1_9CYAN|nr:class I SAM-dependent methyltransferase [Romeriopsis navalis LEGE 11480]
MPNELTKLAFQTFQQGKSTFGFVHKLLANQAMKQFAPPRSESGANYREEETPKVTQALIDEVRGRLDAMAAVDWQDAEAGVYPASLLFDGAWDELVMNYPRVWLDMPKTWERASKKAFRDFDADVDTTGFPSYYTQNFHYQTGGYLSQESAEIYDLQVELLFNGGADPMRRRVLAPLKAGLSGAFGDVEPKQVQVLDVACGTGRTLKMLRGMLPQASLHGVDLSPTYLRKANQLLSRAAGMLPQLVQGQGEALPYRENYFHGVTCVFLFHELPGPVRQQVIDEAFRVVRPGGTFVLCDSIQLDDSPLLSPMMEGFARTFHEPFYRDYVRDDLAARFARAGFEVVETQMHYMSKYLVGRKPVGA